MRFITEFVITEEDKKHNKWKRYLLDRQKHDRQFEMGAMLADRFGWQNPVHGNVLRHLLEIEAFPMDKWIEFKKRLFNALPDYDVTSRIKIINAMAYLESHEKPVTNDQSKTGSQL